MKYFIDTEFIEGFYQPKIFGIPFGKKRHFIDLISIGIVCEDGRSYYAISNEFNPNDADQWVKDNVISKLESKKVYGFPGVMKSNPVYKSNKQIAQDIKEFICPYEQASEYAGVGSIDSGYEGYLIKNPPEFYAYYADYDWVLFCSLFGRMIDLPKGFPMYCIDLKQMIDEEASKMMVKMGHEGKTDHYADNLGFWLNTIKTQSLYPKQNHKHNALADANWNFELYKFLNNN